MQYLCGVLASCYLCPKNRLKGSRKQQAMVKGLIIYRQEGACRHKKPSICEGGRFTTTLQKHLEKGGLSTFQTGSYSLFKDLK